MLKGKTRIELTDVRTGEKQVVEEENMITNALRDQLRFYTAFYSYSAINTNFLPLHEKAMGGIKLFDAALEENPDSYYLPNVKKAKVVGYASVDTTPGDDPMRGSRNLQESKEVENGYQYVWDFATSEANGTIASLGLTTKLGGTKLWFPFREMTDNFLGDEMVISPGFVGIDTEKGIYHTIDWKRDDKKAIVKEYRFLHDSIDLKKILFNPVMEKQTEVAVDLPRIDSYLSFTDGMDGNWYGVSTSGATDGAATVYICSINQETLKSEVKTLTIPDIKINSNHFGNWTIYDGYVYLSKRNGSASKGFYKVKIEDVSDVTEIDFEEWDIAGSNYNSICTIESGMLYSRGVIFDGNEHQTLNQDAPWYGEDYYKFCARTQKGIQIINTYGSGSSKYRTLISPSQNVLMSINNLSSPVVKTADKTMKIIYTVTYQE